jgi:hypothetical protein
MAGCVASSHKKINKINKIKKKKMATQTVGKGRLLILFGGVAKKGGL